VASLLESNSNPTPEEESLWKTTATALYAGGADTTVSALASFFLVMSLYPDVQKKAQAELDRVVPSGRLPNSSDRPQLPYVEALMKEIYRWNPVLPFAIPHKLTQDDIYDGYLIPAGTIVVGNTWKGRFSRSDALSGPLQGGPGETHEVYRSKSSRS